MQYQLCVVKTKTHLKTPDCNEEARSTYNVCMFLSGSNVALARDWILLSYRDLKQKSQTFKSITLWYHLTDTLSYASLSNSDCEQSNNSNFKHNTKNYMSQVTCPEGESILMKTIVVHSL